MSFKSQGGIETYIKHTLSENAPESSNVLEKNFTSKPNIVSGVRRWCYAKSKIARLYMPEKINCTHDAHRASPLYVIYKRQRRSSEAKKREKEEKIPGHHTG